MRRVPYREEIKLVNNFRCDEQIGNLDGDGQAAELGGFPYHAFQVSATVRFHLGNCDALDIIHCQNVTEFSYNVIVLCRAADHRNFATGETVMKPCSVYAMEQSKKRIANAGTGISDQQPTRLVAM